MPAKKADKNDENEILSSTEGVCGIVMPISPMGNYTAEHWADVYTIIADVAEQIDLLPKMVSQSNYIGIIQKRIINNLYHNEIVVCDVSGKNPNVMFELGMRLAFDKPTVIMKDDATDYTFDTSSIEHLTYPRDLRYGMIIKFKEELAAKIMSTRERFKSDKNASTFLREFGEFEVATLPTRSVTESEYALGEIKAEIASLRRELNRAATVSPKISSDDDTEMSGIAAAYQSIYRHFGRIGSARRAALTTEDIELARFALGRAAKSNGISSEDFKGAFDRYVARHLKQE